MNLIAKESHTGYKKDMKVYVFGNPDSFLDDRAFKVEKKLGGKVLGVEFVQVKVNQDLPFADNKNVVLLDTVSEIKNVEVFTIEPSSEKSLEKAPSFSRASVHDFDLGFQLRYLQKIGKLGKVTIVGIPQKGSVNYLRIQSILRKLVAQDMQGS